MPGQKATVHCLWCRGKHPLHAVFVISVACDADRKIHTLRMIAQVVTSIASEPMLSVAK